MGTDRAELRALEGDEEKEDLQDPGELSIVRPHAVAKVIVTDLLLDFALINHSD